MKIKDKFITTMDQLEAMQEDDNWNNEEMLDAAVQLIDLDSDLQSSGTSTSTSPLESDSDCENARGLVSKPFAKESTDSDLLPRGLMHLSLRNNASTSWSTCNHQTHSGLTHTLLVISGTNRTSGRKLSISHGMNTGRNCSMHTMTNSTMVIIFFPPFLFYNWKCCDIPVCTLNTDLYFCLVYDRENVTLV